MEVKLSFDDATVELIKNLTASFERLNDNATAIAEGAGDSKKPAKKKETAAAKKKREACLLYTSPSPRDRQKSRMPSSA